jgi:hypothetical protein
MKSNMADHRYDEMKKKILDGIEKEENRAVIKNEILK